MIYCEDIHWYTAELLEYQVVIPCFFLNSGCQFYDVFQPPFQLRVTWLLSGQRDVNKSMVSMVEDFWDPFGHSLTPPQYLSIKLMPCDQLTNNSLGQSGPVLHVRVIIQADLKEGITEKPQENRFPNRGNRFSSNVTEQGVCLLSHTINPHFLWNTGLHMDSRGRCSW